MYPFNVWCRHFLEATKDINAFGLKWYFYVSAISLRFSKIQQCRKFYLIYNKNLKNNFYELQNHIS